MISRDLYSQRLYETGAYLKPEYSALIHFKTPIPLPLIRDRPLFEILALIWAHTGRHYADDTLLKNMYRHNAVMQHRQGTRCMALRDNTMKMKPKGVMSSLKRYGIPNYVHLVLSYMPEISSEYKGGR